MSFFLIWKTGEKYRKIVAFHTQHAIDGDLKFNTWYQNPFKTRIFTAFQLFQCEPVNEVVCTIVSKLNFTGNISFDFIKRDEKYLLIECNPRITSAIHALRNNPFDKLFFNALGELVCNKAQLFFYMDKRF